MRCDKFTMQQCPSVYHCFSKSSVDPFGTLTDRIPTFPSASRIRITCDTSTNQANPFTFSISRPPLHQPHSDVGSDRVIVSVICDHVEGVDEGIEERYLYFERDGRGSERTWRCRWSTCESSSVICGGFEENLNERSRICRNRIEYVRQFASHASEA